MTEPAPNVVYQAPDGAMMDRSDMIQRMLDSEHFPVRLAAVAAVAVYSFTLAAPVEVLRQLTDTSDMGQQGADLDSVKFAPVGVRGAEETPGKLGSLARRAMGNIQGGA